MPWSEHPEGCHCWGEGEALGWVLRECRGGAFFKEKNDPPQSSQENNLNNFSIKSLNCSKKSLWNLSKKKTTQK
jgi:hypothetical protein